MIEIAAIALSVIVYLSFLIFCVAIIASLFITSTKNYRRLEIAVNLTASIIIVGVPVMLMLYLFRVFLC